MQEAAKVLSSSFLMALRRIPSPSPWMKTMRRSRCGLRRSLPVLLLGLSLRIAGTLLIASLMRGRVVLLVIFEEASRGPYLLTSSTLYAKIVRQDVLNHRFTAFSNSSTIPFISSGRNANALSVSSAGTP